MNIRNILELFKRSGQVKTPLGRWRVHHDRETILKIKYANEDNCGISCLLPPSDPYLFMMGYESVHK